MVASEEGKWGWRGRWETDIFLKETLQNYLTYHTSRYLTFVEIGTWEIGRYTSRETDRRKERKTDS